MKYEGKKKAGDGINDVYTFTIGKEEARLIFDLCNKKYQELRGIFEVSMVKNRLGTIKKNLQKIL